jgi:hypothetical protein
VVSGQFQVPTAFFNSGTEIPDPVEWDVECGQCGERKSLVTAEVRNANLLSSSSYCGHYTNFFLFGKIGFDVNSIIRLSN